MALFYVAYDLDKPGQNYQDLWNELESLSAARIQDSVWALKSTKSAKALRDLLKQHIDSNDRLLVVESASSAWHHLMSSPKDL